ncbi:MAG: NUDIX domain-containing protein [Acidimicrobiia bacterium]|nr:NUDIX domain-containing protein [Acidimicrobiia bacterium]
MNSETLPPQLAVGAVVIADQHLLLIERGRPPSVGLWTVPGGRVEAGERLEDAVQREVAEETGLAVSCGALIGWVQRLGSDFNFVILDFAATISQSPVGESRSLPAPRPGDDASDARWVRLDRLAELPLVDGLLDFLEEHGIVPPYSSSSNGSSLADESGSPASGPA